jgi:hypothetical protein
MMRDTEMRMINHIHHTCSSLVIAEALLKLFVPILPGQKI